MKETGLMFKAPLVRAILEGRKTQTRRIVKRLPLRINRDANAMEIDVANIENGEFAKRIPCPVGKPGDRIYVRETFCYQWSDERGWLDECWFRATTPDVEHPDGGEKSPWKPAIHMPKAVARIWLEITSVRVERLQSISRADAIAEGIQFFNGDHECGAKNYMDKTDMDYSLCPTDSFETLWKSTGGDWEANPWVWVIDFKTISTTGRPA
ncbi:hypothetical protein [Comamonas jiangduensis]|uniref:Morphogenetic protein n=1 Tax=Comamonas jiangduensis TaxID=1194168 RepID=A0ABV4IGI5_9BURK